MNMNQEITKTLRIAYTPDSDDVFNYYGWESGRLSLRDKTLRPVFERDHIIALNRAAEKGLYQVVGVSSVAYPRLAGDYWILAAGNSVGREYGPVLASKNLRKLAELRGKRIAVAGMPTTGGGLAMMYCPEAEFIEERYDRISDAIVEGEYDAGVLIHEELLFFEEKGLHRICDLGKQWCDDTGLPLPVGLNLVQKSLGRELAEEICDICQRSLRWSHAHYDEAFAAASQVGRGCAEEHIRLFSNDDTMFLKDDVRRAMKIMFDRVAELGIGPRLEEFEIIEPKRAA
ncbi:MAG: MqnA/MqnD/SBP family protein [Gammaproteobacteria bacterium]